MITTTDILIIEDDPIMREALAELLEEEGYGVRKAANGSAGLAAVRFAVPALVITDIHMPETNGALVISKLKEQYPGVPVIAISGLFNSGHGLDADAAIRLGAACALASHSSAGICFGRWPTFSDRGPGSRPYRRFWFVYENWRSAEGLHAHMQAPHLQAFLKAAPDLVAGDIDLRRFSMITTPATPRA